MARFQHDAEDAAAFADREARHRVDTGDLDGLRQIVGSCLKERETGFATLIALFDVSMDALQPELALQLAARAVELVPANAVGHYKQAVAHQALWRLAEAEAGYRKALALDASLGKAFNNLGCLYLMRDDHPAATEAFRQAIAADPTLAQPHSNLGLQLLASPMAEQALDCFRRAIAIDPSHVDANLHLQQCLLSMGRNDEAAESYRHARAVDLQGKLELPLALILPEIMESREAIDQAREQMGMRLALLESAAPRIADPISAVPQSYWFFLAYHGLDDRSLVKRIANFFQRACPSLAYRAAHCDKPVRPQADARLRIGFVSSYLKDHTIGKMWMGVIAHLPRDLFEVYVFVPERPPDYVSRYLENRVTASVTLAPSLEDAREQIAGFTLDILLYPDIGMDVFTYFLAFSRLAPMQCTSWGHPMTSGIPAIDYFVSHADGELQGSERYYSEKLLRLPAGDALTYYFRPDTKGLEKTRQHFGLGDSETIYFCPQALFKLHPDQDAVFRDILVSDPNGVLVFLDGGKPLLKQGLLRRMQRVMPGELSRVRFLPPQPYRDFLNLIKVSDVVLDTFVFGGGNTSLEIFAVGRPVVTLPSDQLRGRITLTCCRRMGMEELVAADADDYRAKAVRLGTDRHYRERVEARIAERAHLLFEDAGMVSHLADLLVGAFQRTASR